MKLLIIILSIFTLPLYSQQMYQGPSSGSVESGITKSTNNFTIDNPVENVMPKKNDKESEVQVNFILEAGNHIYKSYNDQHVYERAKKKETTKILSELNFEGPNIIGCWVPDCNVVSGPEDVLIAINTMFWITDREGNLLKQINTNNWFADFIGAGLVFDPKCAYDSLSNRFIMTYLYFHRDSQTSLILLCVSDDSTAEGDWNIWSLPADLNGSTQVNLWADFPSLTVTGDAIYYAYEMLLYPITNQDYDKLRIINKEDVLTPSPGKIIYVDYWDFRKPISPTQSILFLRLVHNLDQSEYVYMISRDPDQFSSNDIFVYKMKDLLANHQIEIFNVETSFFSMPPHMVQKDGGKPMQLFGILYNEGVYRHNKIYLSHAVSSQAGQYSDIHYVELDVDSMKVVNELFVGKRNRSYGFSDLVVDANKNVIMVYNRSGENDYPGAFYSVKPANENNFIDDITLMEGQGNMNQYCGGGTSTFIRFGDYSDISFDALDNDKIWLMNEYIGADNRWKTRVAKISINEIVSSVESDESVTNFYLAQNYPNPFNPLTTIEYQIPNSDFVSLKLYDVIGNEVATLVNEEKSAGKYNVKLKSENLTSGIYLYVLRAGDYVNSRKLILLK